MVFKTYVQHGEIMKYWKIYILGHINPVNDTADIFKGKTLDGAIKSAQRYVKKRNQVCKYETLRVGEVKCECDCYGREKGKGGNF